MNEEITEAIQLLEQAKNSAPKQAVSIIHEAITTLVKALSSAHGSGNTEDHTN